MAKLDPFEQYKKHGLQQPIIIESSRFLYMLLVISAFLFTLIGIWMLLENTDSKEKIDGALVTIFFGASVPGS